MTSLLFGMVLLFSYIGWHLGYEGFIIVGHIEMPYIVEFCMRFALLSISFTLSVGFILREYTWNVLRYSIPLVCADAVRELIFPGMPNIITSGILPIIVLMMVAIPRKSIKRTFLSILLVESVVLIHQIMVSQFTQTPLTNDVPVYTILRLSIDAILLMALFYSLGGVNRELEQMVFPGRTRDRQSRNESNKTDTQATDDVPLDGFEKWVMRSVIGVIQITQWTFILWICSLDNLFLDGLVMTTSFICHGMIINMRQHLKPIIICTLAATAMFYFAARFTMSFQYSQFFPIFIGLILVYTIYRISYQFEKAAKKKSKEDLKRIELLEKEMEEAWGHIDRLA